jgi:hypothetical protein
MFRNLKVLGLALIAVLAMSVVAASAAQAEPTMELGAATAEIEGEQTTGHTFTVDGTSIECTTAKFTSGSVANGSTWVTAHPEYTGCTAFGFLNSSVNTTGCNYEAMANGAEGTEMNFAGELKVVCSGTNKIIIKAPASLPVCEATVGNQTIPAATSGMKWTNNTVSPMDVILHNTNTPVEVTKTKDGFGCPFSGTGATTGTYNGTTTFRAYKVGEPHTPANQLSLTIKP